MTVLDTGEAMWFLTGHGLSEDAAAHVLREMHERGVDYTGPNLRNWVTALGSEA